MTTDQSTLPFTAHLEELRRRLIYSIGVFSVFFVASYFYAETIFAFLVKLFTCLTEAFMTYLKVAFWSALCLSSPFILIQIWLFVAPGLYHREKMAVAPFLVATPVLFLMGAMLAYYVIFPLAWAFFLSFESKTTLGGLPIQLEARVSEYLDLSLKLIFAFGVCFQLPVLLTLLARAGFVTSTFLISKRRHMIVAIFAVAAILTPPDVISQVGLAIPLMILYEISIFLVKGVEKSREQAFDKDSNL